MGLLSRFKQKQEVPENSETGEFHSRAESDTKPGRTSRRNDNARKEKADPALPEKKRARRRLIGAVALVLAAVIGLPMLLDSEPKPLAENIAIEIPSKDKPLSESAPSVRTPKESAELPPEEIIEPDPVPSNASKSDEHLVPAVPASSKDAKVEAKSVTKVAEKPSVKADEKSLRNPEIAIASSKGIQQKSAASSEKMDKVQLPASAEKKADDTSRALAILEGKAAPKVLEKDTAIADKSAGSYVIQVAALSTQEKIHEMQSKLKAAGIQSYTQKVVTSSGDIVRIRVGPFPSKAEADKARARLVKAGLSGTLIPN